MFIFTFQDIYVVNKIGGYSGSVSLTWLIEGLPQLTSLNLNVWVLNQMCFENSFLSIISFWNGIGDSGCISIGEGLKFNSTLTKLYLECEELIMNNWEFNDDMIFMTIYYVYNANDIGDSGGCAIGEGLKFNSTLTMLCLCVRR